MMTLPLATAAWPDNSFAQTLKAELQTLPVDAFPLADAAVLSGYIDETGLEVTVLSSKEVAQQLEVRLGVFFNEFLMGCNCHDDPQPINSYCELMLWLDLVTAEYRFTTA